MPIELTTWECEYCFQEFDSERHCDAHEKDCDMNPNNYKEDTEEDK